MMRTITRHGTEWSRRLIASGTILSALWLLAVGSGAIAQDRAAGGKQAIVTVQGMQCPFCAYGIQKHLKKLPGVTKVDVELAKNQAIVTFAPDAKVTDADIQQAIRKAGFTPGKIEWKSGGSTVKENTADVDWQSGTATVRYDPGTVKPDELLRTIERAGRFQATFQASGR